MVSVNAFKLYQEFLENKAQVGGTLSTTQFNQLCFRSIMTKFERDYQTFLATGEVSEFLKVYLKNTVFNVPASGEYPYPADYQHISSIRKYFIKTNGQGAMIKVTEVSNDAWGLLQISSLQEPLLRFAKYNEFSNIIRFLPRNISIVECDYFKTPVQPIWGFTIVNNRPVYDPATSTDFEMMEYSTNEIAGIFLTLIGANLREGDLLAWSEQYKAENKSKL